MFFFRIAALLAILFVQPALGANSLVISLRDAVAVQSGKILLEDVAELRGPNAAQLEKLAKVTLGSSPGFGLVIAWSRHQIYEIVQSAAGPVAEASFTGAAVVQINLRGRQVESGEIIPILKAYLSEATSYGESEIEIRSIGNLKGIELPPGEIALHVPSKTAITGRGNILIPIEATQAGKSLRIFWVTANIGIRAKVLSAAKTIKYGQVIAADDIAETLTEIFDLRTTYARKPEEVLGKVSGRIFLRGDPLTREAFTNPFLVKNGETVRLRLERNGIILTSLARAEQNGRLGQIIRVRNLDFSTLLKAQVTGRAEVRMQE